MDAFYWCDNVLGVAAISFAAHETYGICIQIVGAVDSWVNDYSPANKLYMFVIAGQYHLTNHVCALNPRKGNWTSPPCQCLRVVGTTIGTLPSP